jgi:predicted dinucleotide-binding enzyme
MAPDARRIGILGSGVVAQALGRGLARHRFEVMLGTRDPAKLAAWKAEPPGTRSVGSFADAARFGDPVILATLGSAAEEVVRLAGPSAFDGKLLIDATNPLDFSKGMPPGLFVGLSDSLGERVQRAAPKAHVVKCFNTVGNTQMVDPKFREGAPRMLICGNDAAAKARVEALVQELGWPGALDVGGIDGARWLEALVPLWVRASSALNAWDGAFRFVR